MIVGDRPIDPDPARLRSTLIDYRVDGRALLDLSDPRQRERLDEIIASGSFATSEQTAGPRILEVCPDVLTRTRGLDPITDDNMGEEWGYLFVH